MDGERGGEDKRDQQSGKLPQSLMWQSLAPSNAMAKPPILHAWRNALRFSALRRPAH
jgi:hypothetical protein